MSRQRNYGTETLFRHGDKVQDGRKKKPTGIATPKPAIQGEIVGPKINSNHMKLEDTFYHVFNVWDIDNQKYFDHDQTVELCRTLKLTHVKEIFKGSFNEFIEKYYDLDTTVNCSHFVKIADSQ